MKNIFNVKIYYKNQPIVINKLLSINCKGIDYVNQFYGKIKVDKKNG